MRAQGGLGGPLWFLKGPRVLGLVSLQPVQRAGGALAQSLPSGVRGRGGGTGQGLGGPRRAPALTRIACSFGVEQDTLFAAAHALGS